MEERDFKSDITLDKHNLDEELLEQSRKYHYYSQVAVEAASARDFAKFQYETLEAQVEREIRKDPAKFGVDKVTDNAIRSVMLTDQRIQDAKLTYLTADKEMKLTQKAEIIIGDMKNILENLTRLFLNNYWAEPRMPKQIMEPAVEAGSSSQREALKQSPRLQRRSA